MALFSLIILMVLSSIGSTHGCQASCAAVECKQQNLEFKCPELHCSDVVLHDVKCGNTSIGEMKCPVVHFGGIKCPELKCPDIKYPDYNCPALVCNNVNLQCPSCIDNTIGIVIMVTVITCLALILVFTYKMKQLCDRSRLQLLEQRPRDVIIDITPLRVERNAANDKRRTSRKKKRQPKEVERSLDPIAEYECRQFDYKAVRALFDNK